MRRAKGRTFLDPQSRRFAPGSGLRPGDGCVARRRAGFSVEAAAGDRAVSRRRTVDVLARALGEAFRERTGATFIVDNKPGGATAIGATACKIADADGYTFCLLTASTISLNPFLYVNLSYDPQKDLEPLSNVVFTHQVMILHRSIPAGSMRELVAYAKENPDRLNFGSFGVGGDSHLVFEWLKAKTGAKMVHVPYGGAAPALLAFERGDAHLLYPVATPAVLERIKSGLAKPIAMPEGVKISALPGV